MIVLFEVSRKLYRLHLAL